MLTGCLGLSHVLHPIGLPSLLHFMHTSIAIYDIRISFTQSKSRDNPFTGMNVTFLVLECMLALVIIFCFIFVRVFQLATM